jgi:hypothetical protein
MKISLRTNLDFGVFASVALMLTVALATGARTLAESHTHARITAPRITDSTAQPAQPEHAAGATFRSISIEIDSPTPIAAYQFELTAEGEAALVGVENGEHPAFAHAPYYDPQALGGGRVIVSAMNTGDNLPSGRTRICRLHFRQSGDVQYQAKLIALADAEGQAIEAELFVVEE